MVTRPVNEGLEGLVKHRGAPTCVETHVKTSIESVKTIYRLHLTEGHMRSRLMGTVVQRSRSCGQSKRGSPVGGLPQTCVCVINLNSLLRVII